jgi:hypothetical protein
MGGNDSELSANIGDARRSVESGQRMFPGIAVNGP